MTNVPRSSAGGAAGEAGSEYRAQVGAYLIAHGLTGRPPAILVEHELGYPVEVIVEADDAVDDLVCTLSTGSRILIQAKRKFGRDARLRAAIAQWAEAIKSKKLGEYDLLVVIGAEVARPALELHAAMERLREGAKQAATRREVLAIDWLDNELEGVLSAEEKRELVRRGRIVSASLGDETNPLLREASLLLESDVVAQGQGKAAVDAFIKDVRRQGRRRFSSDLNSWFLLLRRAEILFKDEPSESPLQAKIKLEKVSTNYLASYERRLDVLRLPRLLDDLTTFRIDNLLDDYYVDIEAVRAERAEQRSSSAPLKYVVMRWRFVCIQGLPGAGKSTALEQLAANWSITEGAPFPIKISLQVVADALRRSGVEMTIEDVIRSCVDHMPHGVDGDLLASECLRHLERGTAGLLLDGLDECGAQRTAVVEHIERLLDYVSPGSALVMSTRSSAAWIAARFDIPIVTLSEPPHLQNNVLQLVEHIGKARDKDNSWIAERQEWIAQSKDRDTILWGVPLLATLAAVLVCSPGTTSLPQERSAILRDAIYASVRDWESIRLRHPDQYQWSQELTSDQLLFGFVLIGHSIMDDCARVDEVYRVVSMQFQAEWKYGRLRSKRVAEEVVRFWDEVAGIFVVDDELGRIRARVRLFAELADALWATDIAESEEKLKWFFSRLDNLDYVESIKLACHADSELVRNLISSFIERYPWYYVDLVTEVLEQVDYQVPVDLQQNLFNLFRSAVRLEPDSGRPAPVNATSIRITLRNRGRDDSPWGWTVRLCALSIPESLRDERRHIVDTQSDMDRRRIGRGLAALSDARADLRELTPTEESDVRAALTIELPAKVVSEPSRASGKTIVIDDSPRLITGHSLFAQQAGDKLRALTRTEAENLSRVRELSSPKFSRQIRLALERHGFDDLVTDSNASIWPVVAGISASLDRSWGRLLDCLARLDNSLSVEELSPADRWRMSDFANTVEVSKILEESIPEFREASSSSMLFDAMRLLLKFYDVDVAKMSAEARLAISVVEYGDRHDVSTLARIPARHEGKPQRVSVDLTQDDLALTAQLLLGESDYIAEIGARIADYSKAREIVDLLPGSMSDVRADRRHLVATLVVWLQPDIGDQQESLWLSGDDPKLRAVAVTHRVHRELVELRVDGISPAVQQLLAHEDWAIRACASRILQQYSIDHAPPLLRTASYWTCSQCESQNTRDLDDCATCDAGRRPSSKG